MLADNVVQHISGLPPEAQSLEGFKQLLPALRQGFPDTFFEIENLLAQGDKVAFRLIWSATHQGELFGIPPTGIRATVTEIGDGDAYVTHRRRQDRGALGRMGCSRPDAADRCRPRARTVGGSQPHLANHDPNTALGFREVQ